MKKTAITSIFPYLKGSHMIGMGTTSMCFFLKNGKVLKLFLNTYNKKQLFNSKQDILCHFDKISEIGNDTYVVPLELLIKDDKLIGYISDYKKSRHIGKLGNNFPLEYLFIEYEKLASDTIKVSEKDYSLSDLHKKNILFNGSYSIIDLDNGYFDNIIVGDDLLNHNMVMINDVIIHSLLGIQMEKIINFNDKELNELYKLSTISEYKNIKQFFLALKKMYQCNTKKDLNKIKNKILTISDNYYSF